MGCSAILCSSHYVIPCMVAGVTGRPAGRWAVAAGLSLIWRSAEPRGAVTRRWTEAAAINAKATQVRAREKVNSARNSLFRLMSRIAPG